MDGMSMPPQAEVEVVETMWQTAEDLISAGGDIVEDIQNNGDISSDIDSQVQQENEETQEPIDDNE
ncbi:hypothetical protein SAMN05216390_1551 [Lachnospiraceae bacterium KH1T2]|nr:hypothetical protein SAMN05216390_1551 [Lachnospiraceae bacterium KH1T2]